MVEGKSAIYDIHDFRQAFIHYFLSSIYSNSQALIHPEYILQNWENSGETVLPSKTRPGLLQFPLLLQEKGKIVHCGKSVWMVRAELAFEASNGSAVELLRLEPADTWKREGATVTAHSYRGNHNSVIKSIEPGGIQLAQNKIKQFHGATLG